MVAAGPGSNESTLQDGEKGTAMVWGAKRALEQGPYLKSKGGDIAVAKQPPQWPLKSTFLKVQYGFYY